MTIAELEDKAWTMDGIRIIVRAPTGTQVQEYTIKKAAMASWSVTKYLTQRIAPLIGDNEVSVIMGSGEEPYGKTLVRTIRQSYT